MSNNTVKIPYIELLEMGIKALQLAGVSPKNAKITVERLLYADLRGYESHGIRRLLMYIPKLQKKLINPTPRIIVKKLAPSIKLVFGDNGLGPVVATRGIKEAIKLSKEHGIAFVGCRDSNHFGAAGPYVLMACNEKIIALAGTNSFPTMAPIHGLQNLIGNNPLAIGVPSNEIMFILDISMSISSRGRIRDMADKKKTLPEGWAVTVNGVPATDPMKALKGFVLPIGLHKGYGLAVAIDILSGVLTGAGFSDGVKSLLQQWDEPQHMGHFFITIDPSRFMKYETFNNRIAQLYETLKSARKIDPQKTILVPGERAATLEKCRRENGIPIDVKTLDHLQNFARGRYNYQPHHY